MVAWPISRASAPVRPPYDKAFCLVTGTRVGVVLALLSMEVGATIIVTAAILGTKALLRSPDFDQRSVHRKMFVRQQGLDLRMVRKPGHELIKNLTVLQPVAVLGEAGRVPNRVVWRKRHEPAVQEIVTSCSINWRSDRMP